MSNTQHRFATMYNTLLVIVAKFMKLLSQLTENVARAFVM